MHNFGQPPAPRTRNNLMESRPRFSPVWRSWRRIWSQRPPSIQVYKVQSASVTARRPVDDDLDSIGKYFLIHFYGYGALLHYDLERHIRRYSSSKLRNEKNALKQEC